MTTGRELLDRNARRLRLIRSRVVVAVAGSLLASLLFPPVLCVSVLLGVLLVDFLGERAFLAMRCPWCGGELGSYSDWRIGVDRVQFCPGCGKSMDDKLLTQGKTTKKAAPWDDELA